MRYSDGPCEQAGGGWDNQGNDGERRGGWGNSNNGGWGSNGGDAASSGASGAASGIIPTPSPLFRPAMLLPSANRCRQSAGVALVTTAAGAVRPTTVPCQRATGLFWTSWMCKSTQQAY